MLAGLRVYAQSFWSALSPAGGDARVFVVLSGHPNRLYLGSTNNSWIYESVDGRESWRRISNLQETIQREPRSLLKTLNAG